MEEAWLDCEAKEEQHLIKTTKLETIFKNPFEIESTFGQINLLSLVLLYIQLTKCDNNLVNFTITLLFLYCVLRGASYLAVDLNNMKLLV